MNVAQQDRIAQREFTCPRCGAEPGKRCWEKARGNPGDGNDKMPEGDQGWWADYRSRLERVARESGQR